MMSDASEFFREVTIRISSSLDIKQALTLTFEYLRHFMPADAISLHYLDLQRRSMFPVARVAREGFRSFRDDPNRETPLDDELLQFLREKERKSDGSSVTMINDPAGIPEPVLRCFPDLAAFSTLALSLSIRHQPVGTIAISAEGHNRYSREHAALLELVKDPIALAMSNARRFMELERMKDLLAEDNRVLSADIERMSGTEVIGADFGLREVMEMVRRGAGTQSPVLLLGETGAGKEVIANAIHMASRRRAGPMIRLQCGAVPETLLDSELFGHEKGAFTGATERKRGRFERADGGTLFLDEIGELSPEAQVKLLRVLQDGQFERVGGAHTIKTDTRVIAATHRDLEQMVRDGQFREDLWYRLSVFPIRIPPLRLRREDIPSLVHYFVERKAQEMNLASVPHIAQATLDRLIAYDWPGNVRELQNIVERALILSDGRRLDIPELRAFPRSSHAAAVQPLAKACRTMDEAIADHIRLALEQTGGKIAGPGGAAELLGMNPSTLRFRMQKLHVRLSKPRRSLQ
jgi:transcriptional regulator with GAF, ATPase, and Fis domain